MEFWGLNPMESNSLRSVFPALKVLSDAMELVIENDTLINRFRKVVIDVRVLMAQSPNDTFMDCLRTLWSGFTFDVEDVDVLLAEQIRADVEETEAILNGYWEGILEETRRELAEQRRAAVPVVAGEGRGAPVIGAKSKAQQQKKKAATAEAEATVIVEGRVAEEKQEEPEEEPGERNDRMIEEEEEEEEGGGQHVVVAAATMAALSLGEKEGREEEEELEEDECSVCLNVIDASGIDNPAGPYAGV
jgi:hypothetical protein